MAKNPFADHEDDALKPVSGAEHDSEVEQIQSLEAIFLDFESGQATLMAEANTAIKQQLTALDNLKINQIQKRLNIEPSDL